MKAAHKIIPMLIICGLLTALTGCASKKQVLANYSFLSDYSKLHQNDPMKVADYIYTNKTVAIGSYDKILLENVAFFFSDHTEYNGIHGDELNELGEAFNTAIVKALAGPYKFTDRAGPGVMRIRLAITNLTATKPVTGAVTTVVPAGLAVSLVKKAVTGTHLGIGDATLEAEAVDSQTNVQIAAIVDKKTGKKYKIAKSTSKWKHVEEMFNDWAKTLRKRLDRLSGR